MKLAWLGCLFLGGLLYAGNQDSDLNVNRRYTVDTVTVAGKGWKTNVVDPQNDKLSTGLRKDLAALVGQKLNPGILDGLADRLKKELSAKEVTHHILRADTPEHVKVEFDVKAPKFNTDLTVSKFVYNSRDGWSGAGAAGFTVQQNSVLFGLASDGDTLNERFAGINARYENKHLGSDKLGLRFQFESYHEQWNGNTLEAAAANPEEVGATYRAPLVDRFVAGNSYYLRGWNKYDIDPIGGNRLVHNAVEYRYGPVQAFYDTGAVWEGGQQPIQRHSVGVAVKESIFTLALAFPVRSGHVDPVVMMGIIY